MPGRTSALKQLATRLAARGKGAGMGGGGHANDPVFTFQADWQKNKWKPALAVTSLVALGVFVPFKCVSFAQKKAGVEW